MYFDCVPARGASCAQVFSQSQMAQAMVQVRFLYQKQIMQVAQIMQRNWYKKLSLPHFDEFV